MNQFISRAALVPSRGRGREAKIDHGRVSCFIKIKSNTTVVQLSMEKFPLDRGYEVYLFKYFLF
jgi:hypothetical protein